MSKFKVAIIGTGGRSNQYATYYAPREDMEIVALVDPRPHNRKTLARMAGIENDFEEYDDWRELYEARDDLDGVAITSPSHVHAEQAVPFLERGLAVSLEKPTANKEVDSRAIVEAERAGGGRAAVGFVLRSAPFYVKIHELIAQGAVGQVVGIEADELVFRGVSSILNRNEYYRHRATGGSLLLMKCCHDMDILNWLTGCRPTAVSSFGRRMIFHPNPSLPETCDECGVAETCKYYKEPDIGAEENQSDRDLYRFIRDNNRCVYNIDRDIIDNQTVIVEYESGAVANFMLSLNTAGPRAGRNIHVLGTKGRIWGELTTSKVRLYDNATDTTREFETATDESGHHGANRKHALLLLDMLNDPAFRPKPDAMDGYISNLICFAADRSRIERRRVDIVYEDSGFAEIR